MLSSMIGTGDHLHAALQRAMQAANLSAVTLPVRGDLATFAEAARVAGLSETATLRAVAGELGVACAESLSSYSTSSDFTAAIPIAFARKHKLLGLAPQIVGGDRLWVAL